MGPLDASLYGCVVVFRILVLGWCATTPGCLYIKGHALASSGLGICSFSRTGLLALTLDYSKTKMQLEGSTNQRTQLSPTLSSLMAWVHCV